MIDYEIVCIESNNKISYWTPWVKITDGTNVSCIKAATTAAVATDTALVVILSPNTAI